MELESGDSEDSESDSESYHSDGFPSYIKGKAHDATPKPDLQEDYNKFETPDKKTRKSSNVSQDDNRVEVKYESMIREKDDSFEVNEMNEISTIQRNNETINIEALDETKFEESKERINPMISPASRIFHEVIGPRGQTLANKTIYDPQESTEYMSTLLKSVNNRNKMFLNPVFEGTPHLENSIK